MQNELEHDLSLASMQDLYAAKNEVASIKKDYLSQGPELVNESQYPFDYEELDSVGKVTQKPLVRELPVMPRQWRPSLGMWRLMLLMGDSVILVVSLTLVFVLAPQFHLGLRVMWTEPHTWVLKLV